jgi:hypothetical protein
MAPRLVAAQQQGLKAERAGRQHRYSPLFAMNSVPFALLGNATRISATANTGRQSMLHLRFDRQVSTAARSVSIRLARLRSIAAF